MNDVNLLLSENENFRVVAVTFDGSTKHYHYKTMFDVKEDDLAVVHSPSNGPTVVTVQDVMAYEEFADNGRYNLKWLMSVVDTAAYDKAVETEANLAKQLNKAKAAKVKEVYLANLKEQLGADTVAELKGLTRL